MPPAAPTIRKRPKSTLGTLEFWWNTSAVSGYILRCAGEPDRNYGPTVGYAAVTGLTNSTNYSFSLIATQGGDESPPSYFRTAQPGVLTGPPTNVQFTPSISNNVGVLTVTWDPPTPVANQSAVGWYIIRAVPTSGPTIVQGAHYYDRIRVIGGLDETKTYTCSLQAINSGGYGAPLVDTVPFGNTAVLSLWLDARDLNTMFEDREGTIPVSDPDTLVLRWNDKSGRNNNFIAVEGTPGVPVYVISPTDCISLNAASMSSLFALSATNTLTIVSVHTIESASPIPVISNIFKRDSANASNLDLNVDIEENMISKYKFGSDFTTIQMRPPFSQNTGGTLLNIVSTSNNTDTISSLYPPVGASPVSQSGRPSLASSQTYILGDTSENNVTLQMHELRVYDGILDQGALNTLNNQLAIKWGASAFPILASSLVQGHIEADTGGDSVTVVDGSGLILVSGFSFMMNGVEVGNSIRWHSINVLSFGSGSPVDSTWPANRGAAILLGNANRKLINLYKTSAMVQVGNYNIIRLYAEFNNDTGNTVEGAMEIRLIKDRVNGNQFIEVCVREGRGTNNNGAISTPGVWNITNGTSYLNTFAITDFNERFPADDTSFVLASDASGIQWGVNYQNFMYLNKSLNTPDDGVSVEITRTGTLVINTPIQFSLNFPGTYEYVTGTWIVYDGNEDEIFRDTDSQSTLFYTFTEGGDYAVEYVLETRNATYTGYNGPFTVEATPTPPTLLSIECNGSFSSPVVGSEVTFAVEYTGTLTGTDEWFIDGLPSGIDTNNSFTHTFGAAGQYVISYVLTDGLSTYDISQTYFAVAASGDNIVLSQAKAVNKFHVPTSYTAANLSLRGGGGGGGRGGDLGSSIGGGGGGAGGSITGTFDISVGAILDARGGAAGALGNIGNGGRGGTTFILSTGAQVFDLSGTGGFGGLSGTNGGSGGSGGIATATGITGLTVSTGATGSSHAGAGGGPGASPNGGTGGDEDDTGGAGGAGSFTLTLSASTPPPTPPTLLSIECNGSFASPVALSSATFTLEYTGTLTGTPEWFIDGATADVYDISSCTNTFSTPGQYVISYSLTNGPSTYDISQTYFAVAASGDNIILTGAKPVVNFRVPVSYTGANVSIRGGGGGGGHGGDDVYGGGGGGAGGRITGTFDISAGAILDAMIGTGGAGGTLAVNSGEGGQGTATYISSSGVQSFDLSGGGGGGGQLGNGGGLPGGGGVPYINGIDGLTSETGDPGYSGGLDGAGGPGANPNGGSGGALYTDGTAGGAGSFTLTLSGSPPPPPILLSITCTENPPLKNAEVTFTVDTSGPIEDYITDAWFVDNVPDDTNTNNTFIKIFDASGQYVISYSLTTGAGTYDISQTYYVVDAVNDDIILTRAKPVTNFLVPPSYTAAEVISLLGGGGGGGGGGGDGELGGGGGGGGGEITGTFDISAGAILDITKGSGGTAGLVSEGGGAGGTTGIYSTGAQTFTLYSEGGYGGSDGTMMGGGAGGGGGATSSTGTINTATLTLTEGTAGNPSGGTGGGSGSGNGGRGGDQGEPGFSAGDPGDFTLKLSFSGATPPINIVDLSAVDISSSGFSLIWGEGSSSSGANQSEFLSATTGFVLAVPSLQNIAGRRIEYYYPNGYQGIVYNGYLRLSNGPAFDMSSNIITFNTSVDPPTNLAISGITTTGATLSFDDLSGLGYSVDVSGPGAPPLVTPEYPFQITGLEPYSYYTAFLTATSAPGNIDSNPASISFTTLPEAPINFPADLSANPIYDVSAVITWTTPTDVVTNIRIVDANMGNNPPDISDNCNGVNYTITGLTANTLYSLNVYFGNVSGYGPSAPLSFTTTPPPDIIYSGFSTPSEIQMPAGYNKLEYIICGGGGGGGAGDNSGGGGLGGLGGAQSNPVTDILTVESGIQIYIVVGQGGDGGTDNTAGGQMGGNTSITIGPSPYSSSGGTGGSFASSENGDGGAGGHNMLTVDSNPIYAGNGGGGGGGEGYFVQGNGGIRGSQARTALTGEGNDTMGANWSGGPYTPGGRGGDGYYYIRIFYQA